jgi:hypothetical protein
MVASSTASVSNVAPDFGVLGNLCLARARGFHDLNDHLYEKIATNDFYSELGNYGELTMSMSEDMMLDDYWTDHP